MITLEIDIKKPIFWSKKHEEIIIRIVQTIFLNRCIDMFSFDKITEEALNYICEEMILPINLMTKEEKTVFKKYNQQKMFELNPELYNKFKIQIES